MDIGKWLSRLSTLTLACASIFAEPHFNLLLGMEGPQLPCPFPSNVTYPNINFNAKGKVDEGATFYFALSNNGGSSRLSSCTCSASSSLILASRRLPLLVRGLLGLPSFTLTSL